MILRLHLRIKPQQLNPLPDEEVIDSSGKPSPVRRDRYYFDRRSERPLFAILARGNDEGTSRYYIDP